MNISVCVGSSCHLRGSYNIIEQMKSSLARYGLTDKVNLGAAFAWANALRASRFALTTRLSPSP